MTGTERGAPARGAPRAESIRWIAVALMALTLIVADFYAAQAFAFFGSPVLTLAAVLCGAVLAGGLALALVRLARGRKAGGAAAATSDPGRRFLWVAFVSFLAVVALAGAVQRGSSMAQLDHRILELVPPTRTRGESAFFHAVAAAGDFSVALGTTASFAVVAKMRGRTFLAAGALAAFMGEEGLVFILQRWVGRPRPALGVLATGPDTGSFPSAFTVRAVIVFGLAAFSVFRFTRSRLVRAGAVLACLGVVLLVGLSRIYLGAEYPTDVAGGSLVGSGLLALILAALSLRGRRRLSSIKGWVNARVLVGAPALALVAAAAVAPLQVQPDATGESRALQTLSAVDETSLSELPRRSEGFDGAPQLPLNLIFVGTREQIVDAFKSHGWTRPDAATAAHTVHVLAAALLGGEYFNAPLSPSFVAAQPESLAFEMPTVAGTLDRRHVVRVWATDYLADGGRSVWVASASFQDAVTFNGPLGVAATRSEAVPDAERDYVTATLGYHPHLISLVPAGPAPSGTVSDGKVQLIGLR